MNQFSQVGKHDLEVIVVFTHGFLHIPKLQKNILLSNQCLPEPCKHPNNLNIDRYGTLGMKNTG